MALGAWVELPFRRRNSCAAAACERVLNLGDRVRKTGFQREREERDSIVQQHQTCPSTQFRFAHHEGQQRQGT
eukprot:1722360-Amphidinium_carterae.1